MQSRLMAESSFSVRTEAHHEWELVIPDSRVFFYPRFNLASFTVQLVNKGNIAEPVMLEVNPEAKLKFSSDEPFEQSRTLLMEPFSDTTLKFFVRYTSDEDRVFDISKVMVHATANGETVTRPVMVEKYSDIYSPFFIDRNLPHQVEAGIRHFTGNDEFLPFIKARGLATFRNQSKLLYNFNYYSVTGAENLISNTYYTFLYSWEQLKVGIGAFSSPLGRNLYTRNGVMVSNTVKLSPGFFLEAFAAQSFYAPKTSAAVGYTINANKKISFHGSFSYDYDREKEVNTASVMFQSSLIPLHTKHNMNFSLYGYNEAHSQTTPYSMTGFAWDINYNGMFGDNIAVRLINNYGSPNIPGAQMGLISLGVNTIFMFGEKKRYVGIDYINARRKYHGYSYEGDKLPDAELYDQYARIVFHSGNRPNHNFDMGPSIEFYRSLRPVPNLPGTFSEYTARKLRFEYKASIFKSLSVNVKMGVSDIYIKDTREIREERYDIHVLGGYNFGHGIAMAFSYDFGPMVNSGLYQFSGDVENHSFSIGPSATMNFLKDRISFNFFSSLIYRFDLNYTSVNINPKVEAFLARDWYLVLSGTYHYTRQVYEKYTGINDYTYLEVSLRKRWGKSDFNKWQRDTRRLKIVMFQDDNANGIKEDEEQGIPFVKTRLKMTQSSSRNVSTEFPVDITLLSNEAGVVIYNRLPMGFYEMSITPLSDVKEYFYVNRSAEKIELTDNSTYYIPFQKATKITGKIALKRAQFIKKGEEDIDLANIRITAYNNQGNSYTAYNNQGNSYSTLTLKDGTFIIFVPGNNTYHVRMPNVFGSSYSILKNDIPVTLTSQPYSNLVFEVSETARQVKFKSSTPAATDTAKQAPLKIKVLHGKFYENRTDTLNTNAHPEFGIQFAPAEVQEMMPGNFYVVLKEAVNQEEAARLRQVFLENGTNCYVGIMKETGQYFVFSNYYKTQPEARKEVDVIRKKPGMNDAYILKLELEEKK